MKQRSKNTGGPAKSRTSIPVNVRRPRDLDYLDSIREGRVPRAATFTDRRKQESKDACRKPASDD
jgi:hypothetical protein